MSVSQVLNAPTYYTTLAVNGALPDPTFCNQCKPGKPIALPFKLASKNLHASRVDARKSRFAPNTPDPFYLTC